METILLLSRNPLSNHAGIEDFTRQQLQPLALLICALSMLLLGFALRPRLRSFVFDCSWLPLFVRMLSSAALPRGPIHDLNWFLSGLWHSYSALCQIYFWLELWIPLFLIRSSSIEHIARMSSIPSSRIISSQNPLQRTYNYEIHSLNIFVLFFWCSALFRAATFNSVLLNTEEDHFFKKYYDNNSYNIN